MTGVKQGLVMLVAALEGFKKQKKRRYHLIRYDFCCQYYTRNSQAFRRINRGGRTSVNGATLDSVPLGVPEPYAGRLFQLSESERHEPRR